MVPEPVIDMPMIKIKGKNMKKNRKIFLILLFSLSLLFHSTNLAESLPRFQQPVLITSAGQSADVQIGGVLFKRAGLTATLSKNATDRELGERKTLAIVIGVSMKGLGAAGLDLDLEKQRVKALIDGAQKKDIPILCLHLGGEARRGDLSDQMIRDFLPSAKMVIVVKSGNKDGLFTKICAENNIPLIVAEKTLEVQKPLEEIFAQDG
jgi:hypothetical protein